MGKRQCYVLFEEIKNKIEMIKREAGTEDRNTNWQTGRRSDPDMRKAYSPA